MGSILLIASLALLGFVFGEEAGEVTIQAPDVTPFGKWGKWSNCSQGRLVTAFQVKVEGKHSIVDDTGLNGVRFYCGRPTTFQDENGESFPTWENVTSDVGLFGHWGYANNCTTYAVGFDLEVQEPQGKYKDDIGASNLKVLCADGAQIEGFYNNGQGHQFPNVTYTGIQRCPTGYALCGIRTKVERYQVLGDDTGLNNLAAKCCAVTDVIPIVSG